MIKPQLETDVLLNKLIPSITSGKQLLTDIEIMDVIRKARKIPDRHEGLHIEGIAMLVSGRFEEGVELCERSIALDTSDAVAWLNFGVAASSLGHHSLQIDILWRAMSYGLSDAYLKALSVASFWLDTKMFQSAISYLRKTDLLNIALDDKQKQEVEFMRELGENIDLISPFAAIAMEIAESEKLNAVNSHVFGDTEHGFSYVLYVEENDAEKLLKINNMALEKIIEKNLQCEDCITVFVSEVH